jgi:hypothetical protein
MLPGMRSSSTEDRRKRNSSDRSSDKNVGIINKRRLEGAVKQNPREEESHKRNWDLREKVAGELTNT